MKHITGFILLSILWGWTLSPAQDARNIEQIAQIKHWTANDVVIDGNLAFCAAGFDGLRLLDIADPTLPVEISSQPITGYARSLIVQDGFAYIAADWGGLVIVDVSIPYHPYETGYSDDYPGQAVSVAKNGDIVFVGYGTRGLAAVDARDAWAPRSLSLYTPGWSVGRLATRSDYLFVAAAERGFYALDISDPLNISQAAHLDNPTYDIQVFDNYAHIARGAAGAARIDVSDPQRLRYSGSFSQRQALTRLTIQGGLLAAMDNMNNSQSVELFSLSPGRTPTALGLYRTNEQLLSMALKEDILALATGKGGLDIIDFQNLQNPRLVGFHFIGMDVMGIEFAGDYACILGDWLTVYDVSSAGRPASVGRVELNITVDPFYMMRNLVYVPCGSDGLRVFDITNPRRPELAGLFSHPNAPFYFNARDVQVVNSLAYIIGSRNVWILDVANPADMQILGYFVYYGDAYPRTLNVYSDYCYVATVFSGVSILDISDVRHIREAGYIACPNYAEDVVVDGDIIYIATWGDQDAGIRIYSLANLAEPVEIGFCPIESRLLDIEKNADFLYVAAYDRGVRVIDISDPERPFEMGCYDDAFDQISSVAPRGNLIYAAGRNHFNTYRLMNRPFDVSSEAVVSPGQFIMLAYPNPFNSRVAFDFNLPQPGKWTLSVYTTNGSEIVRLADGWQSAGLQQVVWNAEGMPSGTFLVYLAGPNRFSTSKVTLIR
ncbi:MAG: hypothetical protein FJY65_11405 [Calditrichaeota bacterium]|nr:hypothetical protein [Calditrichota bacterium]